jgi:ATP-dependent Lon protease
MKNHDWFIRNEDDEEFGEALHRRTEELYHVPDAVPDEDGIIECPVLPLRDLVVFPRMVSLSSSVERPFTGYRRCSDK